MISWCKAPCWTCARLPRKERRDVARSRTIGFSDNISASLTLFFWSSVDHRVLSSEYPQDDPYATWIMWLPFGSALNSLGKGGTTFLELYKNLWTFLLQGKREPWARIIRNLWKEHTLYLTGHMLLSGRSARTLLFVSLIHVSNSAPPGFPSSGNGLWYTRPADNDAWSTEWLPIGNGYLAGQTYHIVPHILIWPTQSYITWRDFPRDDSVEYWVSVVRRAISGSGTTYRILNFLERSLCAPTRRWTYKLIYLSCVQSYNGGNKQPSQQTAMAQDMSNYRQNIFISSTGTIDSMCLLLHWLANTWVLRRHQRFDDRPWRIWWAQLAVCLLHNAFWQCVCVVKVLTLELDIFSAHST